MLYLAIIISKRTSRCVRVEEFGYITNENFVMDCHPSVASLAHSQWFSPLFLQLRVLWMWMIDKEQPHLSSHKGWRGWNQDSHRYVIGSHGYLTWNFSITISITKSLFEHWHYVFKWHYVVLSLISLWDIFNWTWENFCCLRAE